MRRFEASGRRVRSSWCASLGRIDRAHRGLHGDERRRAVRACTRSAAKGRNEVEDGGRPAILSRAVKAACRRRKIAGLKPLPGRTVCRPDRPLKKAVDAVLSEPKGKRHDPTRQETPRRRSIPPSSFRFTPTIRESARRLRRRVEALIAARSASTPSQRRSSLKSSRVGDNTIASIPAALRPVDQTRRRALARRIIVADDIETAQPRRKQDSGEMRRRERRHHRHGG